MCSVYEMLILKLLVILVIVTKSQLIYLFYKNKDDDTNYSEKPIIEIYTIEDFQYLTFPLRVTWFEAKLMCSSYNGQLVKIDTMAKAKRLMKTLENSTIEFNKFWIGGYKSDQLWIWTDNIIISINSTNGFLPLHRKLRASQQCLSVDLNYGAPLFIDLNCNTKKYFICEIELNVPIKKDLLLPSLRITSNSKTFQLYNYKTTWYKASEFCRTKGYRLATISSNEEVRLLTKGMIRSRPSFDNVWIGGYYFHSNWRWLSTGKVIFNTTKFIQQYQNRLNTTSGCIILKRHLNKENFIATSCQNDRKILCETYDPNEIPENELEMVPIANKKCNLFLVARKLSWNEAFQYCSNQSLYLAETEDNELLEMISETMSNQILEMKHLWLGGKLTNSDWVWATSGNKIPNRLIQECMDNDKNNTNHCLNLDIDVDKQPKLYGIKCKSRQFFVCMENACNKTKNIKRYFKGKSGKRRRRKTTPTTKRIEDSNKKIESLTQKEKPTVAFRKITSTSIIYLFPKLNNLKPTTPTKFVSSFTGTAIEVSGRNQEIEHSQICLNRSLPIKLNGIFAIAFFAPITYSEALAKCQIYGGNLASVNRKAVDLIRKSLGNCSKTNLWIYDEGYPCANLYSRENLDNDYVAQNNGCANELGSLCEIGFKMEKELKVDCQNSTVLFGANIVSYSNQNWITMQNVTVNFPICLSINELQNHFLNLLGKIIKEHYGFLFIMDRSTQEHVTKNPSLGLSFMETVLNIFNLNRNLPSGLILFEEHAKVAIPYNETNFCQIRKKHFNLKMIGGFKNKFCFYGNALTQAEIHINQYQPQRRTLIFFISNSTNNGEEYFSVVRRLQQNHTIFSIGSNPDALTDLAYIASSYENNLLMYGFKDFIHMHSIMVSIKYHQGNPHKCLKKK